jgi:hypothetical protein
VAFAALIGLAGCHLFQDNKHEEDKALSNATTIGAPSTFHYRVSQYLFLSDFTLPKNHPIFQELSDLRDQVLKDLQLPESNRLIQVYIFESKEKYEKYMSSKYSDLPVRRAFFIEQPHVGFQSELMVFTYWGDSKEQDLRHELTHGILHSVLREVPIWLDEGLAEVFELPAERKGINPQHLKVLRGAPLHPDLAKLEKLSLVSQMNAPEYREAWAWVHFMLHSKPESKAALLSYLQQLRTQGAASGGLASKLKAVYPNPELAMTEHLMKLTAPATARGTSEK